MGFDIEQVQRDWIDGISGAAFVERVHLYHAQLKALTPQEQARGALISEAEPISFSAAFFAAVSRGMPVILANPNWGSRERTQLAQLVAPGIFFGQNLIESPVRAAPKPPPASILIPTGGTTGGVKLAIHSWDSLAAACRGVQDFLGGGSLDSCCVLPLYHVSGLMQLLRAFHTGGRIRFDEDTVDGRCLSYVPTQLQRALASEERIRAIRRARVIFVGGAALPESIAGQARARKLPVVPVYGMTETAAMCAAVPAQDFLGNPSAGAVPLGGAHFHIESDARLRIHSPALFQGYHGQPPIDRIAGYLTGDTARMDAAGRLHVTGRMDRLINSGGEKIEPAEVESAVLQIQGVREVLAVGLPDEEWGQRLVVYYTTEAGDPVEDWKAHLLKTLAPYKVPKQMICVRALPLNAKGTFAIT